MNRKPIQILLPLIILTMGATFAAAQKTDTADKQLAVKICLQKGGT